MKFDVGPWESFGDEVIQGIDAHIDPNGSIGSTRTLASGR